MSWMQFMTTLEKTIALESNMTGMNTAKNQEIFF